MEFGQVPAEHWRQPDWIDEEKATASRNKMVEDNIIYGGSVSYRNMCRFNSGVRSDWIFTFGLCDIHILFYFLRQFFFKHPLMSKYKWYWRIECVNSFLFFFHNLYFIFIFTFLDLTSNFTVIFYMTRLNLWKKIRKFIVWNYFFPLMSLRSLLILKSI